MMPWVLSTPSSISTDEITFGDELSCDELIRYLLCSNKINPSRPTIRSFGNLLREGILGKIQSGLVGPLYLSDRLHSRTNNEKTHEAFRMVFVSFDTPQAICYSPKNTEPIVTNLFYLHEH